eukprot:7669022-Prorocentrum_lima.AAC.1
MCQGFLCTRSLHDDRKKKLPTRPARHLRCCPAKSMSVIAPVVCRVSDNVAAVAAAACGHGA